jgi:hypothetical protein
MPKQRVSTHPRQIRLEKTVIARFDYTVKTVRALPGGHFQEGGEFNCGSPADAKSAADRLQREFDADSDPCRTYVYRKGDNIPVYAGLQLDKFGGYRG